MNEGVALSKGFISIETKEKKGLFISHSIPSFPKFKEKMIQF